MSGVLSSVSKTVAASMISPRAAADLHLVPTDGSMAEWLTFRFQSQKSIIKLNLGEGRVAACRSSIRELLNCERR